MPPLSFYFIVLLDWCIDKPSLPLEVEPSRFAFLPKIPSAWGWKAGCSEQACGCAWLRLQSCSCWRCLAGTATCTPIHLCLRARPLRVTHHLTQVLMTSMSALHATKYIYRPRLEQSAGGRCARARWMRSRKARWKQQQGGETGGGDRGRALSSISDGSRCHISRVSRTNTRQTELRVVTGVAYTWQNNIKYGKKKKEMNEGWPNEVQLC